MSMFTPPVRTLSILEKLRLLSKEEPLKVVPSRVKEMPWGGEDVSAASELDLCIDAISLQVVGEVFPPV